MVRSRDTTTDSPFHSDSGGSFIRPGEHDRHDGKGNYSHHRPTLRSKIYWYSLQVVLFDGSQTEVDFRNLRWYSSEAWGRGELIDDSRSCLDPLSYMAKYNPILPFCILIPIYLQALGWRRVSLGRQSFHDQCIGVWRCSLGRLRV